MTSKNDSELTSKVFTVRWSTVDTTKCLLLKTSFYYNITTQSHIHSGDRYRPQPTFLLLSNDTTTAKLNNDKNIYYFIKVLHYESGLIDKIDHEDGTKIAINIGQK